MIEPRESTPAESRHTFSVSSYNIHRCIGVDGRRRPFRVAGVIRELNPDIIGLQEVDSQFETHEDADQVSYLGRVTGLQAIPGPTIQRHDGRYGNAVLSARPVQSVRRVDLSVSGREPRGALDVDLDIDHKTIRVVVTHLGLNPAERRKQTKRLLDILSSDQRDALILMGDFNEWALWGRPLRWLRARFGRPPAPATFHSWLRLLALDRIWVWPPEFLLHIRTHVTPLARMASDHLPVKAIVQTPPGRP